MRLSIYKISLSLFSIFLWLFILPASTHARSTTYIGNYEVTTEDNGLKKEVVRVAGSMGKVVKSRNILGNNTPSKWDYAYYTTDIQGSTRQEIPQSNLTTNKIPKPNTYYAYGSPIPVIPSINSGQALSGSEGSRVPNAQTQKIEDTYTGQKKDEETGLMYYNARYYNPSTGIFIQADSVDDTPNKYQYVAGNPVNSTDPSGNVGGNNGEGADCMCGGNRSGIYSEESREFLKTAGKAYGTTLIASAGVGLAVEIGIPVAISGIQSGMKYVAASPAVETAIAKAGTVLEVLDVIDTALSCLGSKWFGMDACAQALSMPMAAPTGMAKWYKSGQESRKLAKYGVNSFEEAVDNAHTILDPETYSLVSDLSGVRGSEDYFGAYNKVLERFKEKGFKVIPVIGDYDAGVNPILRTLEIDAVPMNPLVGLTVASHEYAHAIKINRLRWLSFFIKNEFEATIAGGYAARVLGDGPILREAFDAQRAVFDMVSGLISK